MRRIIVMSSVAATAMAVGFVIWGGPVSDQDTLPQLATPGGMRPGIAGNGSRAIVWLGRRDGHLTLLDYETHEAKLLGNLGAAPLVMSSEGSNFAFWTKEGIYWGQAKEPTKAVKLSGSDQFGAMAFSPDGSLLAARMMESRSTTQPDKLAIWRRGVREPLLEKETDSRISSIAFAPDNDLVAYSLMDGIVLFSIRDNCERTRIWIAHPCSMMAFAPSGRYLVVPVPKRLTLYHPAQVQNEAFSLPIAAGQDMSFLSEKLLLSGRRVLDFATNKVVDVGGLAKDEVLAGNPAERGVWAVSVKEPTRRQIDLPPVSEWKPFDPILPIASVSQKMQFHGLHCFAVSPDGKYIGIIDGRWKLHQIDLKTHKELLSVTAAKPSEGLRLRMLTFFKDSRILVAGDRSLNTQRIFEVATGKTLDKDGPESDAAWHALRKARGLSAESPDGRIRVGAGREGSFGVVSNDPKTIRPGPYIAPDRLDGTSPWQDKHIRFVGLSPQHGIVVACHGGGLVRVWDGKEKEIVHKFDTGQVEMVAALSHDGSILATCAPFMTDGKGNRPPASKEVRLWNVSTGKQIHRITNHKRGVVGVAFTPDGNLVTGGVDGELLVWDVKKMLDSEEN